MLLFNLLLDGEVPPSGDEGSNLSSMIIMGVLVLGIIALFIWNSISNKKKRKAEQEKISALKIGDRVMTIGGICGFVAQINDGENSFVLETGLEENKSFIKFDKGAIYKTAPAEGSANFVGETKAPVKEEVAEKPAKKKAKKQAKEEVIEMPEENVESAE